MTELRDWARCAGVGVANFLGGPGGVEFLAGAAITVNDLFNRIFGRLDRQRTKKLETLCGRLGERLDGLCKARKLEDVTSARNSVEGWLARHGVS